MTEKEKMKKDHLTADAFTKSPRVWTSARKLCFGYGLIVLILLVFSVVSYRAVHNIAENLPKAIDAGETNRAEEIIEHSSRMIVYAVFAMPFLALLIAGGMTWNVTRGIVGSVRRLTEWVEDCSQGIFDYKIEKRMNNEFHELADKLILMCDRRKQIEEALQESKRVLTEAQRIAATGSWQINIPEGRQVLSPMMCDIYGIEKSIISMEEGFNTVHPDDRKKTEEAFKMAVVGKPTFLEYRIVRPNGEVRNVVTHGAVLLRNSDNEPIELIGVTQDITGQKEAENALRESEEKYRSVVEHTSDAIVSLDAMGKITFFNRSAQIIFGYDLKDIMGRPATILVPEELRDEQKKVLNEVKEKGFVRDYETIRMTKDGTRIPVELSVNSMIDEKGRVIGTSAIIRDITERKRTEKKAQEHQAQLAHLSRLQILKEMTSQLAHQIGQPLCAIIANTHACLKMLQAGSISNAELIDVLDEIETQVKRADSIMGRIREFARKQEPHRGRVDIHRIIRNTLELLLAEVNLHNITVHLELSSENTGKEAPLYVLADSILIEQVIVNLVRNAIESMVEIETGERTLTIRTTRTTDDMIDICVSDTGQGIPEEIRDKIFNPFRTTKPKGLGIGLSLGRSIVESHGGRTWMEPNPDKGAIFHFTLPEA